MEGKNTPLYDLIIATDGSCTRNGKQFYLGYAFVVRSNNARFAHLETEFSDASLILESELLLNNSSSTTPVDASIIVNSTVAEILAMTRAIEYLLKIHPSCEGLSIGIFTDNQDVLRIVERKDLNKLSHNMRLKHGADTLCNKVKAIEALLLMMNFGTSITYQHVYSHVPDNVANYQESLNNRCDILARAAKASIEPQHKPRRRNYYPRQPP